MMIVHRAGMTISLEYNAYLSLPLLNQFVDVCTLIQNTFLHSRILIRLLQNAIDQH
jgi:hypothetical protein